MKDLVTIFKALSDETRLWYRICLSPLIQGLASLKEGESIEEYVASVYVEGYK